MAIEIFVGDVSGMAWDEQIVSIRKALAERLTEKEITVIDVKKEGAYTLDVFVNAIQSNPPDAPNDWSKRYYKVVLDARLESAESRKDFDPVEYSRIKDAPKRPTDEEADMKGTAGRCARMCADIVADYLLQHQ